jgi:hypothetical protein
MVIFAPDARHPMITEAWFFESETIRPPFPMIFGSTVELVAYPIGNTMAASLPT